MNFETNQLEPVIKTAQTNSNCLYLGIDTGSTTVKLVVTDKNHQILYKNYRRHLADVNATVINLLEWLAQQTGNIPVIVSITGSAGIGIAERCHIPFIQEVVATCEVIQNNFHNIKTLVDIGGEDAKMIFFNQGKSPDIRMNGNCAGGTGAFIDQMATILGVEVEQLDQLAKNAVTIYPIASRCGVFAKTDVQNLLSRNINKEDITASVFHAVSMQVITSLARGYDIVPNMFVCGGPLAFIPSLRNALQKQVGFENNDIVISEHAEVIAAWGAAINASQLSKTTLLSELINNIKNSNIRVNTHIGHQLKPFFDNEAHFQNWKEEKNKYKLPVADINKMQNSNCFIGIDSGSTTTKIVATDDNGNIFFRFYEHNKGTSLDTVAKGLQKLHEFTQNANKQLIVSGSCVTGYGEDLIKTAFALNYGMVETIAHFTAAHSFDPNLSFILDIGGQDMKATFIENHSIKRLEINEACSSGCGSFIETFAHSLKHSPAQFSDIALKSKYPCDLGTRCTVFMNSKVKQALREGATVDDIAAGLGYSVIKNCLNKVLKLKDTADLGNHIMVQGGTFKNIAVLRALEIETGKNVMITDYPELMGAYGAALFAINQAKTCKPETIQLEQLVVNQPYTSKITICKGCENQCTVTRFTFNNGKHYFAGNKCEKIFTNTGQKVDKGQNIYAEKYKLLFDRQPLQNAKLKIGIPRALGIYENYPFWHTFFSNCNIEVVLSDVSTMKLYEKGIGTVMADNICFPAKLTNGHIYNLIDKKVDRIFLPFVVYEQKEDNNTANSYNCPIVTGYSEVIRSSINPEQKHNIKFDSPTFTFKDKNLMKKACRDYILEILPQTNNQTIDKAFKLALNEQVNYENQLNIRCNQILEQSVTQNKLVIILTGRPYHADPLIQHKISDVISEFGVNVISEDIVRDKNIDTKNINVVTQWAYTNRIMKAALWAANQSINVEYIELTSFGCGPDSFILDDINDILKHKNKNLTILKVDDINNIGSTRLRIRSLIESLKFKEANKFIADKKITSTPPFTVNDQKRKILMPWFGDFYSPFLPPLFGLLGYEAINLPPSDQLSAEYGLKYSNNEICYPATLVVGDFMKALALENYNHNEIALAITQTGGQCRATNYISLLKKALISAGITDIPVVSVSSGDGTINEQPGFDIKWGKVIKLVITVMAYADKLSQMYHATAPREIDKGIAKKLKNKYLQLGAHAVSQNNAASLYKLMEQAADEFNNANNRKNIPRIGIVGEIFVKYNSFAHKNIVNWLVSQGVEPIVPALSDFFTDAFPNNKARIKGNVEQRSRKEKLFTYIAEKYIYNIIHKMEARTKKFPYIYKVRNPHHDAQMAGKIINTNAQFGEGWRIPAEFAHFAEIGVNNVVSLQPFGCIANQVISKGIEKRARELYPSLNLLFLDFDSGMAEANIYNRLHFMLRHARNECKVAAI